MEVCFRSCHRQRVSDTDVDTGIVTVATKIVQAFSNSEVILPPSDFTKQNFEENIITVQTLIENDTPESQQTIRSQLLSGLAETCVGLYSTFHDISTYENGYGHKETRRLGWM
jgi:RNA-dependent RNA polymerase